MKKIQLHAYAKINLTLDVTGKRPNGYHDVEMIMQQISLCDEVTVSSVSYTHLDVYKRQLPGRPGRQSCSY